MNNDKYQQDFQSLLIDRDEKIMAVLGNTWAQTFISTGVLGKGFSILTNKRVYFKGKCLIRKGRGFYSTLEERTVDLTDITGTGFVHNKATWAKILYIICLVLVAFNIFATVLSGSLANLIPVLFYGLLALLFYFLYKKFNYSAFEISYAGGGIAFDMHWITPEESQEFQRQLVLLKQTEDHIDTNIHNTQSDPSISSIPEQLKQYKELLDTGIITQVEFDKKKNELLNK